jgi:lysophospholipase L1-like esterase
MRTIICSLLLGLFSALPVFAAPACDPVALEFNSSAVPPYKSSAMKASMTAQKATPKNAPVMLFGDSQMARWPEDKLADTFGKGNVINLGVSGDRTQNSLWQMDGLDTSAYSPKLIVLSDAANNLGDSEPACAIAHGMEVVIGRLRSTWPQAKIIVLKTLPRGEGFQNADEARNQIFEEIVPKFDDHTVLLDIDRAVTCDGMKEFPKSYLETKWATGKAPSPCKYYEDDLIHISKIGYDDVLKPAIVKKMADLHLKL